VLGKESLSQKAVFGVLFLKSLLTLFFFLTMSKAAISKRQRSGLLTGSEAAHALMPANPSPGFAVHAFFVSRPAFPQENQI
jgi:hypothetical protein